MGCCFARRAGCRLVNTRFQWWYQCRIRRHSGSITFNISLLRAYRSTTLPSGSIQRIHRFDMVPDGHQHIWVRLRRKMLQPYHFNLLVHIHSTPWCPSLILLLCNVGISLTWLGYYNKSDTLLSTMATYSIDGQTPTSFSLHGVAGYLLNQIIFQTPQLSSGSHKLDIAYQGNSQSTPLTLTALLVQSGNAATHNSINLGPIIGGVVGGLALLILAIFGCLFLRRRRKKDSHEIAEPTVVEPFNQPPTATLAPTGSGKSAGISHILL